MKRLFLLPLAALGLCAGWLFSASASERSAAVEPVRLRVELDRPVLPAESRETVIVKVALDGVRRPTARRAPVNVALVIDKSGSMSGERIERAREAALAAVRRLGRDDVVSLVVFDREARVLVPARRVGDGAGLEAAIEGIDASGHTALHAGVVLGAEQLCRHLEDLRTHRVILMSDGQANVGPRSADDLGRLGTELVDQGISVTTVGLGMDYNEDLMAALARRSDGNTYFAAQARDLPRIFDEELGDVLSIVARRVVLEIDFPHGARPVRIVGREGRVEDGRAVVELNQIYGGQEKFALIEVEVEPGRADAVREVARARVRYEDALDARASTQGARVETRFVRERERVVAAVNREVQSDYAQNRLAEAKAEAVALVDAGRSAEAAVRLRRTGAELIALGGSYGNATVLAVAAPAAAIADSVEADGIDNAKRKALRAETEQTFSQQRAE
jgi:Ca-activated chloride channel family protein